MLLIYKTKLSALLTLLTLLSAKKCQLIRESTLSRSWVRCQREKNQGWKNTNVCGMAQIIEGVTEKKSGMKKYNCFVERLKLLKKISVLVHQTAIYYPHLQHKMTFAMLCIYVQLACFEHSFRSMSCFLSSWSIVPSSEYYEEGTSPQIWVSWVEEILENFDATKLWKVFFQMLTPA